MTISEGIHKFSKQKPYTIVKILNSDGKMWTGTNSKKVHMTQVEERVETKKKPKLKIFEKMWGNVLKNGAPPTANLDKMGRYIN